MIFSTAAAAAAALLLTPQFVTCVNHHLVGRPLSQPLCPHTRTHTVSSQQSAHNTRERERLAFEYIDGIARFTQQFE